MNNLLYSLQIPSVTEAKTLQLARSVTAYVNRACPGYVVQAYLETRNTASVIHWIAAYPSDMVRVHLLAQLQSAPEYEALIKN
jgi:hypothetical protein